MINRVYIGKSSKMWKIGETMTTVARRQANIRRYYASDKDFIIMTYVEFDAPQCIRKAAESHAKFIELDGYTLIGNDHFKKQGRYKDFENKDLNHITEFLNSMNINNKVVRK